MRILVSVLVALALHSTLMAAIAQRMSNEQIVSELSALRTANAELGAKITGLEQDKSALTGQVETLQFLLSQSRDQINDMQGDDAEIGRLIGRLERRLSSQSAEMKSLEDKITALEATARVPESTVLGEVGTESNVQGPITVTSSGPTRIVSVQSQQNTGSALSGSPTTGTVTSPNKTVTTTTGPTRITRRTIVNGETVSEVTTTRSAPIESASQTTTNVVTTTSAPDANQTTVATSDEAASDQTALPQGSLGTLSASALPGEAGPLFAEAKSRLLQFDYAGAEDAFRSFLVQFGEDPQAGEAQYWLAEVLYQQQAYPESGQAYTTMIRSYPDDPRAPEALAKLARSMRLVGDVEQACAALDLLPQRYPDASGVTQNLAAGERVRAGCDS